MKENNLYSKVKSEARNARRLLASGEFFDDVVFVKCTNFFPSCIIYVTCLFFGAVTRKLTG